MRPGGFISFIEFDYLDAPVRILAGANTPIPFNLTLEKNCVPQVEDIVDAVKEILVGVRP